MSRLNGTGRTPVPKPSFYYLCRMYAIFSDELMLFAEQAKVSKGVIEKMFIGQPVKFSDAVAVLNALSQKVGKVWTMGNTDVPTIPSESEAS